MERVTAAAMLRDREYPIVLAYQRPPIQRLSGVVRTIRPSDQTLALTDEVWQTLGLEETTGACNASQGRGEAGEGAASHGSCHPLQP